MKAAATAKAAKATAKAKDLGEAILGLVVKLNAAERDKDG